jgi:two-component system chemotaxis sensor kinase CheA
LPLIHLKKMLKIEGGEPSEPENGCRRDGRQPDLGIVVDGVFHTEEIVVNRCR